MGLRLQLRRAQAEAGDIALLFGDESEALTHPYLAHAWAERGADLRVQAPGQARKVAMLGVLDAATREVLVHTSATKRSTDFVVLLERLDRAYGPVPGQARRPVVLVLDNGPIHTSKASLAALAARRAWLTVEWLPRYAPELNAIEGTWRDLKRHYLAHRTFRGADELGSAVLQGRRRPQQGAQPNARPIRPSVSQPIHGCLVLSGGQIVAVLVRVECGDALQDDAGAVAPDGWFLEAGFGCCAVPVLPLFGSLAKALGWVRLRLELGDGVEASSHGAARAGGSADV